MNVESQTTLRGLELISMTEAQRTRVEDAVRASEMLVLAVLGVAQWFSGAREVKNERREPHLRAAE